MNQNMNEGDKNDNDEREEELDEKSRKKEHNNTFHEKRKIRTIVSKTR